MKTLSPNDFGKFNLAEDCRRIRLSDFLREYRPRLKELVLNLEIGLAGMKVELLTTKTRFNGTRFWFKCPSCGRRAGVLYIPPSTNTVGCRYCLGINYGKRRFKGMLEEKFL